VHTQNILSTPDLQASHPTLLLHIILLPSLQNFLPRETVGDLVLNPGLLLLEQQYYPVVGSFLSRLYRSRDQEIVEMLRGRIRTMR
jgi:hypothetical protein